MERANAVSTSEGGTGLQPFMLAISEGTDPTAYIVTHKIPQASLCKLRLTVAAPHTRVPD